MAGIDFEAVRVRHRIGTLAARSGVAVPHAGRVMVFCPAPGHDDRRPSMHLDRDRCYCFGRPAEAGWTDTGMVTELDREPIAVVVDALRSQEKVLSTLADALEAEGAAGLRWTDGHSLLPVTFGAEGAAAYLSIGVTLLREQGPPARFVGGRCLWLREELDAWVAGLPTEPGHRRGRRRGAGATGRTGKAKVL